jgi:Putative lumazine-binding
MTTATTTATTTTATTPDYDEIVRIVQLYIDGFQGDVDKFKEAFHEDAWIFFTEADGVLHKGLLADRFERWAAANRHIEGRVIAVTQAGDVASVLLGYDNTTDPSASFVDIHTLLRINGVWKITNKTATHSSRAAWAKA